MVTAIIPRRYAANVSFVRWLSVRKRLSLLPAPVSGTIRADMKFMTLLKSKIHRATVTQADVNYIGSITIDSNLIERAGLTPGELVHVWNVDNGERFETYVLVGDAGGGDIIVNGAAAHKVQVGHRVIITSFWLTDEPVTPTAILVDEQNRYVRDL